MPHGGFRESKDVVSLPDRLLVPIIKSPPRGLSELELVRLEFEAKKERMMKENKWLREKTEDWKEDRDARIQSLQDFRGMQHGKGNIKNMHEENKKLRAKVK